MYIKVCGLTTQRNLDDISKLRPDYAGVIFVPTSMRYVSPAHPLAIERRTGEGKSTKLIGVFQNASISEIVSITERWKLAAVQLHGAETNEYCIQLKTRIPGVEIFKALGVGGGTHDPYPDADVLLLDSPLGGGSGTKFDWNKIGNHGSKRPVFLSGGIALEDVAAIKKLSGISGVDINSCFEDSPGLKNIEKVEQFIKQVRAL